MKVFRISRQKYSSKLTSSGVANRWNENGQFVIYTGWSRSLSSLELVVHRSSIKPMMKYKVMIIEIQDEDHLFKEVKQTELPRNWRRVASYSELQIIGSNWYKSEESLILKVPSAIIPQESNYIINAKHPEFNKKVKLITIEDYFWDPRLL